MALVKKDVLWCGSWEYPEEVLDLGPKDMAQTTANGNRMIAKGLNIKFCWEHQPNVVPKPASVWASELANPNHAANWARSVITDAVGFERGTNREGRPTVFALFDDAKLTDDERRQMNRAGKVSCRLDRNYRDPATGEKYDGWSISHIAVTPKPVHANQGPFVLMSKAGWLSDRTVYMGEGKPMADKNNDDVPDKESPAKDAPAEEPKEEPSLGGAGQEFKKLLANLSALGFTAGESVKDLKTLNVALEAIAANGGLDDGMGGDDDAALDPNAPDATTGAPGGGMPMMMSQVEMAKRYPARVKNDRAEAVAKVQTAVREGRIPTHVGDKYLGELSSFQMSYAAGELKRNGVLAKIDLLDDLPKGTFLTGKRHGLRKSFQMGQIGGNTEVARSPEKFNSSKSPDEAEAEANAEYIRKQAERNNPAGAKR